MYFSAQTYQLFESNVTKTLQYSLFETHIFLTIFHKLIVHEHIFLSSVCRTKTTIWEKCFLKSKTFQLDAVWQRHIGSIPRQCREIGFKCAVTVAALRLHSLPICDISFMHKIGIGLEYTLMLSFQQHIEAS